MDYGDSWVIAITVLNVSKIHEHMVRWEDGWASSSVDNRWRHLSFQQKEDAEAHLVGLVVEDSTAKYARVAVVMQEKDLHKAEGSRSVVQLGDALEAGMTVEGVPGEKFVPWEYAGRMCRCGGRMTGFSCDDCGRDVS